MGRPSRIDEQRRELTPVIVKAFTDLGYRRATTAELAKRCEIGENILYRLWKDKKAMFLASLAYVHDLATETWEKKAGAGPELGVGEVLDYEAQHLGEFGHYRLLFTGLSEADDPEIRAALREVYRRFHSWIEERLTASDCPNSELRAWALVGLGTIATIGRELRMLDRKERADLVGGIGREIAGA